MNLKIFLPLVLLIIWKTCAHTYIVPLGYEIQLSASINNSEISGNVNIHLTVLQATDEISLNGFYFNIHEALLERYFNDSPVNYNKLSAISTEETLILYSSATIEPDNYKLHLSFSANENLQEEIFKTYYINGERWLVYARSAPAFCAFPYFSEPHSANFTLRISHSVNQTVLSNTDLDKWEINHETNIWSSQFKSTPHISPHLLSFAMMDSFKPKIYHNKIKISPEYPEENDFIIPQIERIQKTLSNLLALESEQFFPHIHFVVVPDSINVGTSNLELIYFKQSEFYCKANIWSVQSHRDVFKFLTKNLALQWFNTVVIPSWWNYTWMNEGFSEYYAYYVYNLLEPKSSAIESFLIDSFQSALRADSLVTSPRLNVDIYTTGERATHSTLFSKGAVIIRMLSHVLGGSGFNKTVQYFLKKYLYTTVTPKDFLQVAQSVCDYGSCEGDLHENLEHYLTSWMELEGYPLLTVIRNYENSTVIVTQERFLKDGRQISLYDSDLWNVAINYASESSHNFNSTANMHWLLNKKGTYTLKMKSSEWIILNKQVTGFYRVNYDLKNWYKIIHYLKFGNITNIHVLNRAQLLNDAFSLAYGSYLNYSIAFSLATYLNRETRYAPWMSAINEMIILDAKLKKTPISETFKTYFGKLLRSMEQKLTYEESANDSDDTKVLRNQILIASCKMGSKNCVERAEKYLNEYYNSPDPDFHVLPSNLKPWIYCEGLRRANESVWYFLYSIASKTDIGSEKNVILRSLICTENKNLYEQYLKVLLLRKEKSILDYTLSTTVFDVKMTDIAIKFLVKNRKTIRETFNMEVTKYIQTIAKSLNTMQQFRQLRGFLILDHNSVGIGESDLTLFEAEVENNIKWYEVHEKTISESLKQEIARMWNGAFLLESNLKMILSLIMLLIFMN